MKKYSNISQNLFISVFLLIQVTLFGNEGITSFSLKADKDLISIAEIWINEFNQQNPQINIFIESEEGSSNTSSIVLLELPSNQEKNDESQIQINVGRIGIVPVINQNNPHFSRQQRRGIRVGQLKEVFFSEEFEFLGASTEQDEPDYVIYSPMPHEAIALSFSDFYQKTSTDLNGIYVAGDYKHVLNALLHDQDAISYGRLTHVFDTQTRQPIEGLQVLPIDLNNNGRLDRNEAVFDNLDLIIQLFENNQAPIPFLNLSFALDYKALENPGIHKFIQWVISEGSQLNKQLGIIKGVDSFPELNISQNTVTQFN